MLQPDDSPLFAEDFRWTLSQIRQCVPVGINSHMPDKYDAESLLMLELAETEHLRDEWARIAESYRTLAEVSIETIARLEEQNKRMRALIKNMGDELLLRKPQ